MEYSLVFTIYGLIFTTMLLITLIMKKRKKTVRTKIYTMLVISGMLLAISEIATIMTYIKITTNELIFEINWKTRMTSIFIYVELMVWYLDILTNGERYQTLKDTILKSKKNLFTIIIFTTLMLVYIIFGNYYLNSIDELVYISGFVGNAVLAISIITAIYLLVVALKVRKEKKNIFRCFTLIFILLMIFAPIQILIPKISFMPFLTMFILYIIYHNVENPDIELLEEVTILKGNIDKSSNAKLDFLFNLSYDLINPMNVIVSLSDSLSNIEKLDKESVINDTTSIKYAGNTLLDSIDNILDISNDNQEGKLNLKEYNVLELLNRMKTLAITRIGAKQIIFEMEIDDNINSKLKGDITKIQKVLMNVLTNAAKYTEIGKIRLIVTCSTEKDIQTLHIKITDTGCGIKDEDQPNIFTDSTETSGVGLALSKKYLDIMKGTIKVESVYGAGSSFMIDIPQQIVGTRLISEDKKEEQQIKSLEIIDCSNYKALIVDDDNLDIKVTRRLLEKYKFNIEIMNSSLECIDRIKQEEEYDIIFMDHKMPDLDGMEAMKVIKGLEGYKIPKIVVLTANAVTGAKEFYKNEGFDDYISKPIDLGELDKIIKRNFKEKSIAE